MGGSHNWPWGAAFHFCQPPPTQGTCWVAAFSRFSKTCLCGAGDKNKSSGCWPTPQTHRTCCVCGSSVESPDKRVIRGGAGRRGPRPSMRWGCHNWELVGRRDVKCSDGTRTHSDVGCTSETSGRGSNQGIHDPLLFLPGSPEKSWPCSDGSCSPGAGNDLEPKQGTDFKGTESHLLFCSQGLGKVAPL